MNRLSLVTIAASISLGIREQAYSRDAGVTWETNWIMHFTRKAES
jgi:hypothetical protein